MTQYIYDVVFLCRRRDGIQTRLSLLATFVNTMPFFDVIVVYYIVCRAAMEMSSSNHEGDYA